MDLKNLRVDQVGSLLRPAELVELMLRSTVQSAPLDSEIVAAQDAAIREAVKQQESIGMPVVTDGEFRRQSFQDSFGEVAGAEQLWNSIAPSRDEDEPLAAPGELAPNPVMGRIKREPLTEPLYLRNNRPRDEFCFVQQVATHPVKVTLIGIDRIHERIDFEASKSVYGSEEEAMSAVVSVSREIVAGLVEAGCRYIQIDGPYYTRFVDPDSLSKLEAMGVDPIEELDRAIAWDNAVIEGFQDVVFGMHLCRGNRRSMWHRRGAYDAIAERLFTSLNHERLLLEYDSPRAGTFEPLRFIPAGKVAVLGLVTTKVGKLEEAGDIQRRIEEASRNVPLERLALSPQCGFASNVVGNRLTADEQWRKLELVVSVADDVWGLDGFPDAEGLNATTSRL